jgi:hypothetical protein
MSTHRALWITLLLAVAGQVDATERWFLGAGAAAASVDGIAQAETTGFQVISPALVVGINGLPFKGDDVSWRLFGGYAFSPRISAQLGYASLGRFRSERIGLASERLRLSARALQLEAVYRHPLGTSVYAMWAAGISRDRFTADGSVAPIALPGVPFIAPGGGVVIPPGTVAFEPLPRLYAATPRDRTGYLWSAGFGWRGPRPVAVELSYRRDILKVIDVDSVGLTVTWGFGRVAR